MLARVMPNAETGAWPKQDTALPAAGKEVGAPSQEGFCGQLTSAGARSFEQGQSARGTAQQRSTQP